MIVRRWYLKVVGLIALGLTSELVGQAPEPPLPPESSLGPVVDLKNSLGAPTSTASDSDALKQAREALGKKQFDRARELYLAAYQSDSTNRDAALEYADTYYAEERYEESLAEFTKVAEAFPRFDKVYHWRGDAYRNLKRFAEAEADYTQALELSPNSAIFLMERAKVRAAKDGTPTPSWMLPWGLRLSQNAVQRAQILHARGAYSQQRGDSASALADFIAAANLQPDNAVYLNEAAWRLASSPHPQQRNAVLALEWATRACALAKYENADYLDTLAAACAECGRFEQAVAVQQEALARAPEADRAKFAANLERRRSQQSLNSRNDQPSEAAESLSSVPAPPAP